METWKGGGGLGSKVWSCKINRRGGGVQIKGGGWTDKGGGMPISENTGEG